MTTAATAPEERADRKALAVIFGIVFLDLVGVGILIPITPFLVRQFRTDAFTVGLLALVFSAGQFLASPVLGILSDRFGRRPILLFSIVGSAFGYFLFGLAGSLWVLFLGRIIDGITGGNISTAQAYIADVTPPADRSKNFGLIGAAFGLGFIIGPSLGGLFAKISLQAPAYAAAILSLLTAAAGFFFMPESLPEHRRRASIRLTDLNPLRQLGLSLERPELRGLLFGIFLVNFAFSGMQTNLAVFTFDRFGMGPDANAWLFAFVGVTAALVQGVLLRKISGRFSEATLSISGYSILAVGFAAVAAAPSRAMMYPAVGLLSLGIGLATPSLTGLLSQRVSWQEQGFVLGALQSVASLGRVGGPAWAGAIYDATGPGSPYWTGAVWTLAAVWLVVRACRIPHPQLKTDSVGN